MNRQKALTGALLILLALLLWDLGNRAILYSPLPVASSDTRPGVPEKLEDAQGFSPAWGKEIENKNLFNKSRSIRVSPPEGQGRPKSAVSKQPAQKDRPPEVRPELTLSGIIKNQFGEYVAFVILNGQDTVGARKGEMVGDAKVTHIDKRNVTLSWRGSEIRLSLGSQPLIKR